MADRFDKTHCMHIRNSQYNSFIKERKADMWGKLSLSHKGRLKVQDCSGQLQEYLFQKKKESKKAGHEPDLDLLSTKLKTLALFLTLEERKNQESEHLWKNTTVENINIEKQF